MVSVDHQAGRSAVLARQDAAPDQCSSLFVPALLHCRLPLQFVEGSMRQHASACIEVLWADGDCWLGGLIIQQSANFHRRKLLRIKREEGRLNGTVISLFLNFPAKLIFQPLKFRWIGRRLLGFIIEQQPELLGNPI
ncbi:hypothetical protein CK489_13420 [Bradyrhizobium sp. UFLA03-84]|nr:hypothetical protein CK489_13420 [Bradyrhizobium sp. UFLA03-84]